MSPHIYGPLTASVLCRINQVGSLSEVQAEAMRAHWSTHSIPAWRESMAATDELLGSSGRIWYRTPVWDTVEEVLVQNAPAGVVQASLAAELVSDLLEPEHYLTLSAPLVLALELPLWFPEVASMGLFVEMLANNVSITEARQAVALLA